MFGFKYYDDFENVIGKEIYSKFDEDSGDEFEVEIAPDEKLVGFVVK